MIRNLFKVLFFPLLGIMRPKEKSDSAVPPPANPNRVHVFHGTFTSELDATSYCLDAPSRNEPEPLTRDLPDAMIDTSEVEIIFGAARIGSAVPMLTKRPEALLDQIRSDNTLVLIAEAAFAGLPYTLNDTPMLRYAGPFEAR
jgi:hypothetical protein